MQPGTIIPAPNLFPSANVVYVDNDFTKLRSKGLLAYGTIEDAIISWRAGGAARAKYGTPTATSRGTIILGAGKIESALSTTTTEVDINVDYLNIVGQGKDATIVTTVNSLTQSLLAIAATNINFFNFTIFGTTAVSGIFRLAVSTYSGTWHNIKITGDANSAYVSFGTGGVDLLNAGFFDCEFDFSAGTATPTSAITIGGTTAGSNVWKFYNCVFKANSSASKLLSINGRVDDGNFIDCVFSGTVSTALVETGTIYYLGNFQNCIFNSQASTSAIGLKISDSDPEIVVQGCFINARGSCISGGFSNRTRISNSYLVCFGTNTDAINSIGSIGLAVHGCRIVSQGTGLAINADGALNAQITHCTLRKPNVNTAGSSISSNITNVASGGGSSNEELESSVNY